MGIRKLSLSGALDEAILLLGLTLSLYHNSKPMSVPRQNALGWRWTAVVTIWLFGPTGGAFAQSARDLDLGPLIPPALLQTIPPGETRTPPVQALAQAPQPLTGNDQILDYFDGLRAWELGERAKATAGRGDRRSMRRTAQLYEDGKELPKDDALGFFWFSVAGQNGDRDSMTDASRLSPKLPSASLDAIKRSVLEWKPLSSKSEASRSFGQNTRTSKYSRELRYYFRSIA